MSSTPTETTTNPVEVVGHWLQNLMDADVVQPGRRQGRDLRLAE
jgi:hypothetical protein